MRQWKKLKCMGEKHADESKLLACMCLEDVELPAPDRQEEHRSRTSLILSMAIVGGKTGECLCRDEKQSATTEGKATTEIDALVDVKQDGGPSDRLQAGGGRG